MTAGRLGVMCGETWTTLEPGDYINGPRRNSALFPQRGGRRRHRDHRFRAQGFERFFLEYRVDVDEPGAFETSVSETTIARVIKGCGRFGMILASA